MLDQADRMAFALAIVSADQQIAGLQSASAQVSKLRDRDQALDTANSHLFIPVNNLINQYQAEFNLIDGNNRTSITEQNIIDAANRILNNVFFPNNVLSNIPSLSALNNVWIQTTPFALAYAIGLPYNQTFTPVTAEEQLISTIQGYITAAGSNSDIQNTSGEQCVDGGTCSLSMYTNEIDCLAHSGIWTPSETIEPYPAVITLKDNLVIAVNSLISQVTSEAAAISAIVDSDPTRTSQNAAALNYINSTLLPALNLWISYPDFNPVPGSVTDCATFNSYNSNLLAPTKLHSTQLAALGSVLSARSSFLTGTRVPQLNTNLGTVSQSITDGSFSGSGLYYKRFTYMNLRLNLMFGSLTNLTSDNQTINAQTQLVNNLNTEVAAYMAIVPTVLLSASGNGTPVIGLKDASFFSPGDTVYIMSNNQPELQFAIKSINGKSVQLNNPLPSKYTVVEQVRIYKDLS